MTAEVATHRKPRQHPLASGTVRTAATLALAGAATATAPTGVGHAAGRPAPAQLRAEVDRSYRQAEEATEQYNGAKEQADRVEAALERLRDEAARRTRQLNAARDALGAYAAAQYRDGGIPATVRLLLSSSPERFLEQAELADRAGSEQSAALGRYEHGLRGVRRVRATADARLAELRSRQEALARHKRTIEAKLADARRLLARLPQDDRETAERGDGADDASDVPSAVLRTAAHALPAPGTRAPTERAARAVAFAYSALGKPYVWGATGPGAFDCSGLTQAAWQAAGVSLPRTTYTQIDAGRRIARSQLAPGDLVFFYSGVSHVGLYIGDGRMIHAPHPGAPVRIAPIDQMPFAGASRPE
ncbi:NlpC/P60 family protein [Streptomyces gamaensis]|uniref:NlpC/P60 family protein n=1 Tax=Streptomyces gamaensis TaxID=1763542 RepID=A0ABW0ZBB3_9ACTN